MSTRKIALLVVVVMVFTILASACTGAPASAPADEAGGAEGTAAEEPVTITVWDYYGGSTPIEPLVEPFEAEYPGIKVDVQALDWDTTLDKLNVVLTGGEAPDVVTLDMTWLPTFAPLGAFLDLSALSNGQLNGVPLEEAYSPGAFDAMSYDGQVLTMLYDFDVYALYYRADLLDELGLEPPKTWDELTDVLGQLTVDGNYQYAFLTDPFHGAQWIYENGGDLLNEDNTAALFNSPEAVEAIEFYAGLLNDGLAYYWSADEGWEVTPGLKDGRLAMFSDGPYYMGIIKDAAPEMSGMWRVAPHPSGKGPGSYLGGTGLVIPASSDNQDAAWKFIEFAMREENQIGVFEYAGAAPALLAALDSPEVSVADPYFGDQITLEVFKEAMSTARPFPYVRQWNDIGDYFTVAMEEIALGQKSAQDALDNAAAQADEALAE